MADVHLLAPNGEPYVPNSPQRLFHSSPAKYRAFIGGVGAGKSLVNANECLMTLLRYPGTVGALGRWSFLELERTTWDTLLQITPKILIREVKKAPDLSLTLINGSRIYGINLQNPDRLTSYNLGFVGLDEISEIADAGIYHQLQMRLRHPAGPHRMWVTGTASCGKNWLYRTFVTEKRGDHALIRAKTAENPHLPEGYCDHLRTLFSDQMAARYLDGDFVGIDGLILHNFDERLHVIDPFVIPDHWPRYAGLDPGHSQDEAACLWAAVDTQGNIFLHDLYYQTGRTISEQVRDILSRGGKPVQWTAIDPIAGGQKNDMVGKTRLQLYQEAGLLPLYPGGSSVHDAVAQLLDLLRVDPRRRHPTTDRLGSPRLFVFQTPAMAPLIQEIASWRWDPRSGGGPWGARPLDGNDHAVSALRFLITRGPQPAPPQLTELPMNDAWARFHALAAELGEERHTPAVGSQGIGWSR